MTDQLLTLKALLEQANFNVYAFDVGRSVVPIDNERWNSFEHGLSPWTTSVMQHAHFALLGIDNKLEHSIAWFFKLPLDERAHLNLGARDQLIETLIQRAGENAAALEKGESSDLRSAAADLVQSITLSTEKQARFHALARQALRLEPTEHYQAAIELIDSSDTQAWASLPLQGLAELAVRHEAQGNTQRLSTLAEHLDTTSLVHLTSVIDGESIRPRLARVLLKRIDAILHNDTSDTESLFIAQALSHADKESYHRAAQAIINSSKGVSTDGVSIIAGRFWRALQDPKLALQFLENVAMLDNGRSFTSVIQQLLYLTDIRPFLLAALNDPKRSETLGGVVEKLLNRSS